MEQRLDSGRIYGWEINPSKIGFPGYIVSFPKRRILLEIWGDERVRIGDGRWFGLGVILDGRKISIWSF
jgi:hypothetical protein